MSKVPYSFNRHILVDDLVRGTFCLVCGRTIHWNRVWKGEELIPICPGKIQPPHKKRDIRCGSEFFCLQSQRSNTAKDLEN